MKFEFADRLQKLPPYLFAELDRLRDAVAARGVDIIDLGVGDPDHGSPAHVVESLCQAAADPANHHYPAYSGMSSFRDTAAQWIKNRFGLTLDPAKEVIALIGSKEGVAHFPLAFVNIGDVVLVPSPAYPVYHASTIMAGGEPVEMPLLKENDFLPDLDAIKPEDLKRAKALVINYPNNPTAATADLDFYKKVVEFCHEHGLILVSDAAYTEMAFDGYQPHSILEVPGAKEVAIEFHSLSKTYNMTGWRIGYAIGNEDLVAGLGKVKSQIDSGAFDVVQQAGITAMTGDQDFVYRNNEMYKGRRDVLVEGLRNLGLDVATPKATFYVWCPCPDGLTSTEFTTRMLEECGVVSTPGNGFGAPGEGYVRFALTVSKGRLQEAVERIAKMGL
ncbi:LL-diaminopimelate aminotransferase [Dethiosulfatarculus sandiegensis]|uniref:Aminotransferase n=1 Tax=Dethiosulfatarculus sandiegensis TaxID=1429043 RepID=A0A0D2HM52_9BACT|nr:LL-diaminopimelate aminotransferase [Dethiosulfatarculus sandiegensis]KIX11698.1 diaminopimelate aminotransferase [Dethiosulfatarculus sandiegensis]